MLWGRKEASPVTLSGAPLCFSLVQPHWEPEGKEVTDTFLRLNLLLLVRSKVKGKTVSRSVEQVEKSFYFGLIENFAKDALAGGWLPGSR